MAKNFQELRAGMSAKAKAASAAERRRLVEEMSLHQLRKARELTQTKIAEELHMGQGDVSKLERRTDMYVSTLASYLQAVGADLEIRAVFPDGRAVKITRFLDERARVAESADATDLKSVFRQRECGFKSRPGHQRLVLLH